MKPNTDTHTHTRRHQELKNKHDSLTLAPKTLAAALSAPLFLLFWVVYFTVPALFIPSSSSSSWKLESSVCVCAPAGTHWHTRACRHSGCVKLARQVRLVAAVADVGRFTRHARRQLHQSHRHTSEQARQARRVEIGQGDASGGRHAFCRGVKGPPQLPLAISSLSSQRAGSVRIRNCLSVCEYVCVCVCV